MKFPYVLHKMLGFFRSNPHVYSNITISVDQCTVEPSFFVVHDPHDHDDSAGPVGGSQELQLHGVVAGDGRKRTLAVGVPSGSTTSNSGYRFSAVAQMDAHRR